MLNLQFQLMRICDRNRDGSYGTQAVRRQMLFQISRELSELGFKNMKSQSLKPKHVEALVNFWQKRNLSIGTIKNRMAVLRWWAEKTGLESIIPKDNSALGIADRQYVNNENNKAEALDYKKLELINDHHVKMSLELQAAFGLRREEAIKFQPEYADRGDKLVLKSSWCKGGREREIYIRNEYQREVLNRAHKLAGRGSLIPSHKNYYEQLKLYEGQTRTAGFSKLHGLRHQYAQTRYQELTGRSAPAAGGKTSDYLSPEEKRADREARLQISRELGHEREEITATYLGR